MQHLKHLKFPWTTSSHRSLCWWAWRWFIFIQIALDLPTALIVAGGITTNFSSKRIPEKTVVKPRHFRWTNIWLWALIFIIAGVFSEAARKQNWENRKAFNLFEMNYRFGSFVFGGGDVADTTDAGPIRGKAQLAQSDWKKHERYPHREGRNTHRAGMVRAFQPGFSIASYAGGLALKDEGAEKQLLGCIIGMVSIFFTQRLAGAVFFRFGNLKIRGGVPAGEGINAVVVGIMWLPPFTCWRCFHYFTPTAQRTEYCRDRQHLPGAAT